jgi:hypothetical protein
MIKFIGNTSSIINWDDVINELETQEPAFIGPRHRSNDPVIGISNIAKLWDDAGLKTLDQGGTVGWDMFFPGKQFDRTVVDRFANFVDVDPLNCWISRVHPGNVAAWHWDANDNEELYQEMNLVRFSCHVSKPAVGHVLIVEDHCFYNEEQGNTYQWPLRMSWHGGSNCGLVPKYIFNFFGLVR